MFNHARACEASYGGMDDINMVNSKKMFAKVWGGTI